MVIADQRHGSGKVDRFAKAFSSTKQQQLRERDSRRRGSADAFYRQRFVRFIHARSRDAADELMPMIDIKHNDAMSAGLQVIANARRCYIQVSFFVCFLRQHITGIAYYYEQ